MNLDSSSFEQCETSTSFEIIEEVKHYGATSTSYKVKLWGKQFFLKRPKTEFSNNPKYIAAFEKEFDLGFNLEHPNIVRYHSKGYDEQGIYFLTDYVDGQTLTEHIEQYGKLSKGEAYKVIVQIANALDYLHSHQIVHFDIKPDNILITNNGRSIKLIDLGFAYSDCYEAIASGSRTFSAPEQFTSSQNVDLRADIYALGKVIEFITSSYKGVARKATQIAPSKRYSNVKELLKALQPSRWYIYVMVVVIVVSLGYIGASILNDNKETREQHDVLEQMREEMRQTAIRIYEPCFDFPDITQENVYLALKLQSQCINQAISELNKIAIRYKSQHPSLGAEIESIMIEEYKRVANPIYDRFDINEVLNR